MAVLFLALLVLALLLDLFGIATAWAAEHPGWHLGKLLTVLVFGLAYLAVHFWRRQNRQSRLAEAAQVQSLALAGTAESTPVAALNGSADPILLLDGGGVITFFNRAAEQASGYAAAEICGQHFAKTGLVAPSSLGAAQDAFQQAITGQNLERTELEVVRKDGSSVFMETNPTVLRKAGVVAGVQISFRDVSVRKQTEAALRESESGLLLAQQIGHVGSWQLDLTTRKLTWSAETHRIFGVDPATFTPTQDAFYAAVLMADQEMVRRTVEEAIHDRKSYSLDHRIVRPDGTMRNVHEEAKVLYDDQNRPVRMVGTVHDITERRQLEDHLRQSQKLEAVGRLAGGMAHDFNNILTIIQGYTEVILATPNLNPVTAARLKQVSAAADRAVNLTRQLLAFSRKQVMRPEPLELNTALRNDAQMLERILGPKVSLELNLQPNLPLLNADPDMLEEVLLNLCDNSRDAMPEGGTVSITTSVRDFTAADARNHPESRPGRFVGLAFADSGCGMDATTAAQVFEPFFTTKGQGGSKGMGMATVYGLVKQHQGWIELETAPEKGTTFRIYLPEATEDVPADETPAGRGTYSGGSENILLVEDEAPLRALAAVILQRNGYTIYEAGSGPEALEVWKKHGHQVQMLLTDMVMPGGMTGRDLALKLQELKPGLRVLYTSGYSRDIVEADFALKEGIRFLQKPYNSGSLAQAVRDCLDASPAPS